MNLPIPIYYCEDDKTKHKHYDFEEMAKSLEQTIKEELDRKVSISIMEEQ